MVLAIALLAGGGMSTYALQETSVDTTSISVTQQEDVYVKISFSDLNSNVQNAITKLSDKYTVKELAYNAEKKLTKVTLISKEDESQTVVLLDDEGKQIQ